MVVLEVFLALLLVAANAFFVAAEFAFVKVRATKLEELSAKGSQNAHIALGMVKDLDAALSATQLGITLASLGLGWIGEPAFAELLHDPLEALGLSGAGYKHGAAAILAFVLITFLHIILGELVPKSLAIQKTTRVVLWLAIPLRIFYFISYPALWLLNHTASLILRSFGLRSVAEHETLLGPEELKLVVAASQEYGLLNRHQGVIMTSTLTIGDRSVKEIMTPWRDVTFLSTHLSFEENLSTAVESSLTHFLLCEKGYADRILGMIHIRDLLLANQSGHTNIVMLARPVFFISESQTIGRLLQEFHRKKIPLGVVSDDHGSTLGIVTVEETVEMLVGDSQEEREPQGPLWRKLPDGDLLVDGKVSSSELTRRFGIDHPRIKESATVAGFLVTMLGRVPEVGDAIELGDYRFEVAEMKRPWITMVRVSLLKEHPGA